MRGRLVNPFLVHIAGIDTAATSTATGYDDVWREPKKTSAGTGPGVSALRYKTEVLVPAQVEIGTFEKMQMFFAGNNPSTRMSIVIHLKWLEDNGYIDSVGAAIIPRISDKLTAISDPDGNLVQTFREPFFCVEAQATGYGFGRRRNLVVGFFECRENAVK